MKTNENSREFDLIFLNNFSVVLQTNGFCHLYKDLKHLVFDLKYFLSTGDTRLMEIDQPEQRLEYDITLQNFCYSWFDQTNFMKIENIDTSIDSLSDFQTLYFL